MLYSLTLFVHILGALALFAAFGLEWTSVLRLQRARTADQAREWLSVVSSLRWIAPAALLILLLTGGFMTATTWGGQVWIGVALAALVTILVVGGALTGPRMAAIARVTTAEGSSVSMGFQQRLQDPLLWASLHVRSAIAVSIIYLMTIKPALVGSLLAVGIALMLGIATSMWAQRRMGAVAAA